MKMIHTRKPSPLVGEGVNRQVDGRGKCEQTYKKYFFVTAENGLPVKYNKGKKEFIFHSFI